MGLSAPPALPAWRIHFPAPCSPRLASRFCPGLVAGFHTRFGPPPPFPTTLTAFASPCPVACFSHSRPWGLLSQLPVAALPRRPCGLVVCAQGTGSHPGGSWSSLCRVAAEAAPLRRSAAPFARRRPFRLQLPCACHRCVHPQPARVPPEGGALAFAGRVAVRVAPADRPRRPTEVVPPGPARLDPAQGLPLPRVADPRPRVTAVMGRSRRARALSDPLRSRLAALPRCEPFASAGSRLPRRLVRSPPPRGWALPACRDCRASHEDSSQPVKEHQPSRSNLGRWFRTVNERSRVSSGRRKPAISMGS